jgi:hypothetical protein
MVVMKSLFKIVGWSWDFLNFSRISAHKISTAKLSFAQPTRGEILFVVDYLISVLSAFTFQL